MKDLGCKFCERKGHVGAMCWYRPEAIPKDGNKKDEDKKKEKDKEEYGKFWLCFGCGKRCDDMNLQKCPHCKDKRDKENTKKEPQIMPKNAQKILEKEAGMSDSEDDGVKDEVQKKREGLYSLLQEEDDNDMKAQIQ